MSAFAAARLDSLVRYLRRHVSGEVRADDTSRHLYSTDASHYSLRPLAVVLPKTADDLAVTVQIARELAVPITARGGGTSLSGQSIGPGLIVDCSKSFNQLLDVDRTRRTARVRPGIVLDHLNRHLAADGLMFGPDVATANRATLGGMIGNNSAGARSVVYRQTVDHVNSLSAILSDGTTATFGPLSSRDAERKHELRTREGDLYRTARRIVQSHAEEIGRRFPKILRKVSGYNLPGLLPDPGNLAPLVVGSEGTLAVIAEADLALVPRPRHRGLLVPHFDSLRAALDAVHVCLGAGPSAVELMDTMLIELARTQRSLKAAMAAIQGSPQALLMVEFSSDEPAEIDDRIARLSVAFRGARGLTAAVTATDPALRDPLWNLRSGAVPLLYGIPGKRKPITFVEDCAVSPERMPEFATRFREIFKRHGTDGAFYGHASVGCLHIRPMLDLHQTADVATMRAIAEEVTDLVLEFNGSLSGEHGDGLVRSEWNRKMFGDEIYGAFREIKRAFDPDNLLNPGKIVDAPRMEENLRFPPGAAPPEVPSAFSGPPRDRRTPLVVFDYSAQGDFFRSIELCNGAGVCRKTQGGAMCPSFRATRDEKDSTRGRANALRIALQNPPVKKSAPLEERWLADVMDLCLGCKACKSECPSNVDLAKLKAEFQHSFFARRPRPLGHRLVKNIQRLSARGSLLAGLANWLGRRSLVRYLMEWSAGIDRRRSLPELHYHHFRRWFANRTDRRVGPPVAILLDDCFTTYQEPRIGRAAVNLLEAAGYSVELAGICCGRAMLSKGYLDEAKATATAGVQRLKAAAAAGTPILGLEPSCILTLTDEWPELVNDPATKTIAARVELVEAFVASRLDFEPLPNRLMVHPHCHQAALGHTGGTVQALRRVPGLEARVLDVGCCGMAGSFGYEVGHYEVSVSIANLALVPEITASPDSIPVATGTSCRHQIRDLTGRTAFHPVEVLASALKKS